MAKGLEVFGGVGSSEFFGEDVVDVGGRGDASLAEAFGAEGSGGEDEAAEFAPGAAVAALGGRGSGIGRGRVGCGAAAIAAAVAEEATAGRVWARGGEASGHWLGEDFFKQRGEPIKVVAELHGEGKEGCDGEDEDDEDGGACGGGEVSPELEEGWHGLSFLCV